MRGLWIMLSGTLGAGVALGGSAGYLHTVGPAPLRFQTSVPREARAPLPPLRMEDATEPSPPAPVETEPAEQTNEPAPANQLSDPSGAESVEVGPPMPTNSVSPLSATNNATNTVISPQELLRFFLPSGAGNPRGAAVVAPLGFRPPPPAVPAASSAIHAASKP